MTTRSRSRALFSLAGILGLVCIALAIAVRFVAPAAALGATLAVTAASHVASPATVMFVRPAFNLLGFLQMPAIFGLMTLAIGTFLGTRIKVLPRDMGRAVILDKIAEGAAALALAMYPNAAWSQLLDQTVRAIAAAAGVPTENADAIKRAAAAALVRAGVLAGK